MKIRLVREIEPGYVWWKVERKLWLIGWCTYPHADAISTHEEKPRKLFESIKKGHIPFSREIVETTSV